MSKQLPSFLGDEEIELVFFGGKGGVGKTTCASASALQMAEPGKKTLLMSINPAHSLSSVFSREIGDEPTEIDGNLYAMEANSEKLLEEYKKRFETHIKTIVERGTPANAEDMEKFWDLSLPGVDEVMAMLKLMDFSKEEKFDQFIVDMAATGHIIRFLSLPDLMEMTIDILRRMQERYKYIKQSFTGRKSRDELDEFLDEQIRDLNNFTALMQNPAKTEFVPVTISESMGVEETEILIDAIQRYKINVKNIILNKVWKSKECDFCSSRKKDQEQYVEQMLDLFKDYNVIQVPQYPTSITGLEKLEEFGKTLSGEPYQFELRRGIEEVPKMESEIEAGTEIRDLGKQDLLLFGGKGGLGKTTVASTTALALNQEFPQKKILIFSTDPAQALGRCFDLPIGEEPIQIRGNLSAMAMDADEMLEEFKETYKEEINEIFEASSGSAGMDMPIDRNIYNRAIDLTPPGLDELMALSKILDLMEENEYDLFILDTAPSGHALRLLETPKLISDWFRKLTETIRKYEGVVDLHKISLLIMEKWKGIKELIDLLHDEDRTEFVVVTVPSKMEVSETKRLISRLRELGIPVHRILANKVTPPSECDFCRTRRAEELENLKEIYDEFSDLLVDEIPLFPHEIQGIDDLTDFAKVTYH